MVFKRKNSPYYYYRFTRNGVAVYVNTKQRNKDTAIEMEAAHRTRLAKGEAGLRDPKATPTLKQFQERFLKFIETRHAAKPRTIEFYSLMLKTLVSWPALANQRLDRIDEAVIERYIQHRRSQTVRAKEDGPIVSASTVNRELATLRRALRLAQEWKIIIGVPRLRMLPGENNREFVLSRDQEVKYLAACRDPLRDAAVLILDTGLRVGEALNLRWADVVLVPADGKKFGYIQVRAGKTKNAKRTVSLTARATEVLATRKSEAVNDLVFPGDSLEKPFVNSSLAHQHASVRDTLDMPKEFVIHSLRHTALTRLGEAGADAFTIMRIAGHSSITVSQRYVHPSDDAMESAFEKLEKWGMVGAQTSGSNENHSQVVERTAMGA